MKRRSFVGLAVTALPLAAAIDVASIKSRTAKVEIAFKSPHRHPNGLQATAEGLWVLDQAAENYVSLVSFADGKVIREFQVPGLAGASGLTVDSEGTMWINDTHNSIIVACSSQDGKVSAKYWCHGAGRLFRMKGDPPTSRSPLPPAFEEAAAPAAAAAPRRRSNLPYGQLPLDAKDGLGGEGGQGMEFRDGLLYYTCLPTRKLYVVNPKSWEVQDTWDLPGNRAHGVGWEGDTLWASDTNWMAFFRHDMKTGKIVEKIQLTDKDPQIHGVTVHDGKMWYCDEMGYICNFKL